MSISSTISAYEERLVSDKSILEISGSGWNASAMHNLDPVEVSEHNWVAAVDGFAEYPIYGLQS